MIVQTATGPQEITIQTQPGPQINGFGRGRGIYMLATDEADRVVPLPGTNHRRVYVSGNGLTEADIAVAEGVSVGTVTGAWLRDSHPEYGESEALALHPSIGFALWDAIPKQNSSHWLLYERGHTYTTSRGPGGDGESPLHPIFVGAWGEGAAPVLTSSMGLGDLSNVVVQGLDFNGASPSGLNANNIILDNLSVSGAGLVLHTSGTTERMSGITIRNTSIVDAPENGIFNNDTDGLLLEGIFFDYNGWTGVLHDVYLWGTTLDVTARDIITMRAAGNGVMARGGMFAENIVGMNSHWVTMAFGSDSFDLRDFANYSLGMDLVDTAALQWRGFTGAINTQVPLSSFVDALVVHAAQEGNPNHPSMGVNADFGGTGSTAVFWHNIIRWRWDPDRPLTAFEQAALEGVNPVSANATTIWDYAATLPNGGVPSGPVGQFDPEIVALAQYLRGISDGTQIADEATALNNYFRAGFGLDLIRQRADPTTLQFVPDFRGEGTRWDNRLNWRLPSGDRADGMPIPGDTLNLRGCIVRTYQTWTGTVNLQGGTLIVSGGKIDGSVVGPGTVRLEKAGRLGATISGGATVDDQRAGLAASVVEWT